MPKLKPRKYKLYNVDCREVCTREMEAESIDTVITDPPYGLKFMGKDWDYGVPGVGFWTRIMRVCKPGAMLLAFGGTRTFHRLACAIEDAGWEMRDCLMYLYGSGFPKSLDVSKAIDKKAFSDWLAAHLTEAKRLKAIKDDDERDDYLDQLRKAAGAEREVVGPNPYNKLRGRSTGDHTIVGSQEDCNITAPATEAAKLWDGWGTALKPAFEPILLAMKPLDGTFAQNALKYGVAGLNVDGARVGTEENLSGGAYAKSGKSREQMWGEDAGNSWRRDKGLEYTQPQGRFPANLVLSHHSECVQVDTNGVEDWRCHEDCPVGMLGKPARFFYCAKASKRERNEGLEDLPTKNLAGHNKWTDCDYRKGEGEVTAKPQQNHHPTVKPLALMEYLCKLTMTPTGGVVFDPFMGSGTTGVACANTGREFVGCENDTEQGYFEIAKQRIRKAYQK